MTARAVLMLGFHERKERGSSSKLEYLRRRSLERFMLLPWVLEARRLNLRTAHRRYCRRAGLRFH